MTVQRPTPHPAAYWFDEVARARKAEHRSRLYAEAIGGMSDLPGNPYWTDLRSARRRAAVAEADAWRDYAVDCETAFESAASHETAIDSGGGAAKGKRGAPARTIRDPRIRADVPCCPPGTPASVVEYCHGDDLSSLDRLDGLGGRR